MNHHDEATMNQVSADVLAPELRAFEGIDGAPIRLADGNEWLLADGGLWNALDEVRDRLDDAARLSGEVDMRDIRYAAFVLLKANYRLADREAAGLLLEVESQPLADAVGAALFGAASDRKTYTTWAYSALLANGLDPATIPGAVLPHVLNQLVATGRAVPADGFIDSAVAAPRLAAMRAKAARFAAQVQTTDPPAPPPEA